jgi:hypothetical protein
MGMVQGPKCHRVSPRCSLVINTDWPVIKYPSLKKPLNESHAQRSIVQAFCCGLVLGHMAWFLFLSTRLEEKDLAGVAVLSARWEAKPARSDKKWLVIKI